MNIKDFVDAPRGMLKNPNAIDSKGNAIYLFTWNRRVVRTKVRDVHAAEVPHEKRAAQLVHNLANDVSATLNDPDRWHLFLVAA